MFQFYVKTGILFIILCGVSGLPYSGKEIKTDDFDFDNESEDPFLSRPRRTPHYTGPGEPGFGGGIYHHGGPHGPIGRNHPGRGPFGPGRRGPYGPGHGPWKQGPNPHSFEEGEYGEPHPYGHPDPHMPFRHSPEWHKDHPQFGYDPHHYDHHHKPSHPHNPEDHRPWDESSEKNEKNYPKLPTKTNVPLKPEPKLDNSDIKPVSEPNFDIDNPIQGNPRPVTQGPSTMYPDIDIRLGAR